MRYIVSSTLLFAYRFCDLKRPRLGRGRIFPDTDVGAWQYCGIMTALDPFPTFK
jgi:hypothetical protein